MVTYLEKTDGNAEFHEIIDFLIRSSIYYALTVSPVVSTMFVEQFWMTAKSKTINNVRYITAIVAGKPVSISEASIRRYEGDLNTLTFNKGLFSPQWKFLFHTIIHCLSSKSTSWDQIPTNIATAVICLATNQVYNFSKLIFDGMMRHLDSKKKFVMYPRFILVFLTNQLKNVPVPLDHFPINALTTKVFSFMVKKGKKISRNVTPLFPSMLAQPTEDEGTVSERPSETQPTPSITYPSEDQSEPQPDPFLRPFSSNPIPDSILEGLVGIIEIKQLKKKARPVINHHKAWIKSLSMRKRLARKKKMESISKQGRKTFKSVPTVHKDPSFDDLDDAMDYMETEDAHDEGTVKKQNTDKPNKGIAEPNEGTAEPKDGNSDESAAPITFFRDDETIAQFLVTMSQNKTKQKGVEIKEIKDTDRSRTTIERSILTLKPLPKIDPKDKGKKVLEEKAESEAESKGVNEAEKKFKMLANDEEIAKKKQASYKKSAEKPNDDILEVCRWIQIPDEYLLKFHNVADAKSLWAAIKSRFGGNEESKKMQKNVLKHQFENFTTASNESLDKAYVVPAGKVIIIVSTGRLSLVPTGRILSPGEDIHAYQSSSRLDVTVKFIFQSSRYVVPTGRVVVLTDRYVVPAGKVIIIVSTGRLSLVPTGRILSPGRVK
ncbi:hypothetical protein Tco_1012556 [Tanacetum coccineum]